MPLEVSGLLKLIFSIVGMSEEVTEDDALRTPPFDKLFLLRFTIGRTPVSFGNSLTREKPSFLLRRRVLTFC